MWADPTLGFLTCRYATEPIRKPASPARLTQVCPITKGRNRAEKADSGEARNWEFSLIDCWAAGYWGCSEAEFEGPCGGAQAREKKSRREAPDEGTKVFPTAVLLTEWIRTASKGVGRLIAKGPLCCTSDFGDRRFWRSYQRRGSARSSRVPGSQDPRVGRWITSEW